MLHGWQPFELCEFTIHTICGKQSVSIGNHRMVGNEIRLEESILYDKVD